MTAEQKQIKKLKAEVARLERENDTLGMEASATRMAWEAMREVNEKLQASLGAANRELVDQGMTIVHMAKAAAGR